MPSLFFLPLVAALIAVPVDRADGRQWDVGASRTYTVPSQVAALVGHGDTVNIDAGSYVDCATWTRNDLLLRGLGGYAHLHDKACGGKAIWIIQGNNTTVEWIEFSGATVVDKNGAGIRQEGPNLTVRHCFFHDNEDGILAGDNPGSSILIEYSEFARNGYGDGYSHNMYINHVGHFTLRHCYVHHAKVGHNVKSRAYQTFILYNRISDETDGTASRDIDLPNGGFAVVLGNVIHHGPRTQNSNTLGYGLEGLTNPIRLLAVVHNTFVSERPSGSFLQIPATGTDTVIMKNNLFVPQSTMLSGQASLLFSGGNLRAGSTALAGFLNAGAYDYRLLSTSPAIDQGVMPDTVRGFPLVPTDEYVHPAGRRSRYSDGLPDAGAYEYMPATGVGRHDAPSVPGAALLETYPNPFRGSTTIRFTVTPATGGMSRVRLRIIDLLGREIAMLVDRETPAGTHDVVFDAAAAGVSPGFLVIDLSTPTTHTTKGFLLYR